MAARRRSGQRCPDCRFAADCGPWILCLPGRAGSAGMGIVNIGAMVRPATGRPASVRRHSMVSQSRNNRLAGLSRSSKSALAHRGRYPSGRCRPVSRYSIGIGISLCCHAAKSSPPDKAPTISILVEARSRPTLGSKRKGRDGRSVATSNRGCRALSICRVNQFTVRIAVLGRLR